MEKARMKAREQFREMRFGLFVHWGIYSLLGRGEWVMYHEKIPRQEYEKLMHQFNPTLFNAREWVQLVKKAGMRYITITAKHHDGFCMYDSDLTDYKITNTPYRRDPIADLARECQRQKIALLFYYSPLDWHHPAYENDWETYTRYWHGQVLELFRKYQPFGIWLDGCWHKPEQLDATWKLTQLYREIRKIAPGAIIGNNHHQPPLPDEDIQTFEQDLPGENTAGFNPVKPVEDALYETCMTINNSWGYHASDHNYKSVETLIKILSTCAGRDANLLLNVGPKPDGTIQSEFVERLEGMGKWLAIYGEAIYRTRGRLIPEAEWGTLTARNKRYFLHLWKIPPDRTIVIASFPMRVRKAFWMDTKDPVPFAQEAQTLRVTLPERNLTKGVEVIELEVV